MKKKNIISLAVAFAFLALSITGILLYIKQKAHVVEITHTIFGLTFVGFAIFHILNNWSSITAYSKERQSGKFQKEFLVAAAVFGLLLIGTFTELLEPVAEAGRIFAPARPKEQRAEKISFEQIETNKSTQGTAMNIILQKGKEVQLPIIAIWVEDSTHQFVENLFVPSKVVSLSEEEKKEGKKPQLQDFQVNTLPTWQTKANGAKANYEKETPNENFILKTNTVAKAPYFIMIEVKSNDKTEMYEAQIAADGNTVFKLKSKDNTLITRGIIEF
ncbi:MAG: DUF4405 domain-containing protein [Cytophagales bacterium]|nr:MAG: DUF4405 domain-containing protein [Cytophagales bacterium]